MWKEYCAGLVICLAALARGDKLTNLETNEIQDANPSYNFEYKVADDEEQVYQQHQQNMENKVVTGEYSWVDPEGTLHLTRYRADETGFHIVENVQQKNFVKIVPHERPTSPKKKLLRKRVKVPGSTQSTGLRNLAAAGNGRRVPVKIVPAAAAAAPFQRVVVAAPAASAPVLLNNRPPVLVQRRPTTTVVRVADEQPLSPVLTPIPSPTKSAAVLLTPTPAVSPSPAAVAASPIPLLSPVVPPVGLQPLRLTPAAAPTTSTGNLQSFVNLGPLRPLAAFGGGAPFQPLIVGSGFRPVRQLATNKKSSS